MVENKTFFLFFVLFVITFILVYKILEETKTNNVSIENDFDSTDEPIIDLPPAFTLFPDPEIPENNLIKKNVLFSPFRFFENKSTNLFPSGNIIFAFDIKFQKDFEGTVISKYDVAQNLNKKSFLLERFRNGSLKFSIFFGSVKVIYQTLPVSTEDEKKMNIFLYYNYKSPKLEIFVDGFPISIIAPTNAQKNKKFNFYNSIDNSIRLNTKFDSFFRFPQKKAIFSNFCFFKSQLTDAERNFFRNIFRIQKQIDFNDPLFLKVISFFPFGSSIFDSEEELVDLKLDKVFFKQDSVIINNSIFLKGWDFDD